MNRTPSLKQFANIAFLSLGLAAPFAHGAVDAPPATVALKRYVISDYGAVADGTTLNSAAIQKAIDTASEAGGGVVEIPKGTFRSGSIFLKKGVELYLAEDAVLLGSQNIEDYPKRDTRIEGHVEPWRMALVNVQNMDRVRISGKGQLNGNGQVYWDAFAAGRRANAAVTNLGVERPRLLFVDTCQDVRVEGISLKDSGFWNFHLYRCNNVVIEGLTISAPPRTPSTDGIDIDSSQNVVVRNCSITCNDDNIALKGSKGPLADQDKTSPPVENILVENCTVGNGNGLITCGSEATFIRNVTVRNCTITGDATLLTLKLRTDTPQQYSNITMDGIKLTGSGRLLNVAPWSQFFNLQGQKRPSHVVENITLRNISGNFGQFGTIRGNPAYPESDTPADVIKNFTFENVNVTFTNASFVPTPVENMVFKNVTINGQPYTGPTTFASLNPVVGRGGRGAGPNAGPGGNGAPAPANAAPGNVAPGTAAPGAPAPTGTGNAAPATPAPVASGTAAPAVTPGSTTP